MGLIAWYPLNGDLEDYTGNENGLINNGAVVNNNGKIGKCYYNNGINSNLKIPIKTSKTMTFMLWIKIPFDPTTISGFKHIIDCRDGAGYETLVFMPTYLKFFNSSKNLLFSEYNDFKDKWHHIATTINADTKETKLFIDGELKVTSTSNESSENASGYAVIGSRYSNEYYIEEYINDIRIYNHCLSKEQIHQISQGLILHYPLNSGYGNENLLVNTYEGYYGNGTVLTDETYNGFKIRYLKYEGTSYQDCINKNSIISPTANTYYTISFWAKGNCGISNFFYPNNCASGISSDGHTTTSVDGNCYISLTSEWKRYWITWKTRSDVSGAKNIVVGRIQNQGTGAECYIAGLKFEEGDKNSVWSPNEADDLYSQLGYNSTTVYDTSGFGNNAEKINTPIYTSDTPLYDSSIVFDGETQHLITNSDLTSIFNSGEFSISFWIKVKSINTSESSFILCCGDNNETNKMLHIAIRNTGQFAFCFYDNDYNTSYNFSSHLNEWIFITCTYKDLIQKVYVNGELYGNNTSSNNLSIPNSSKLFIGKRSNRETYANVDLSNLKVYSTALSTEDIKQLYQTKAKIDKNGNLYCNQFIDNDYEEELLTTQKMTFHQANSQGTITYETNGNEVINIITMDNTISSWKYLFNSAFDKTKIINHKLKLNFKYKTDISNEYSLLVKMCKGDSTKPQTISNGKIIPKSDWQEYNGIITFGNTYDSQGIYISYEGDFRGGNLYIKDLSLKIYENNNKTDFTKKSQIITGELSELDSNKTYVYKNSKIVTNQIIEN